MAGKDDETKDRNKSKFSRLSWRLRGALAIVALSVAVVAADRAFVGWAFQNLDPSAALWRVAQKEVESGTEPADAGSTIDYIARHNVDILRINWLKDLLGLTYSYKVQSPPLWRFEENDPEARFCRRMLDYKWLHPLQGGATFPQVRATLDDVRDWVSRCRREWNSLGSEEQHILSGLRQAGHIPEDIVVQPIYDPEKLARAARTEGAVEEYKAGRRLSEEALKRLINESISGSFWNSASEGRPFQRSPMLPEAEMQLASARMLDYYKSLDMRDIPKVPSDWRAIARTIREGGTAVFDAVPLLPKRLFNISFKGLADMEGADASRTTILSNGCKPRSLSNFADMHSSVEPLSPRPLISLADNMAITFGNPDVSVGAATALHNAAPKGSNPLLKDRCEVGYINNRRMKQMYKMLPNLTKEMGMEDEVLREEGYLWMGPVRGGFHYDEEANVYIQLSGESDTFLIPQSHVDMFSQGQRNKNLPRREEVEMDPWMKRVPFHLHRLKPGEGLVFPGRTFHLFLAQSYNRLAINFFFMPKWRKMEYTKYDWYSQEAAEPQGLTRLALRQLWARTFVRLYEETGKGVIYMGEKNEYI